MISRKNNAGETVYELVPTNRLPANLPPVREWKLYGIKSSHTDVGLHNSQYIQRHGSVRRIDEAAHLIDADTRKVLWEKECHKPVPVASMSKMMTLLLTMEHLDAHPELSLETPVRISKEVLRLPSREGIVWLDPKETFPIADLVKCAAIKSANDAALQLALTVSGSEAERFMPCSVTS